MICGSLRLSICLLAQLCVAINYHQQTWLLLEVRFMLGRQDAYRIYDGVYNTLLGWFSKLHCSTTKRVPIPNDTSAASSRRDVSNAYLCGASIIPTVEVSSIGHRPRGVCVIYTLSYSNTKDVINSYLTLPNYCNNSYYCSRDVQPTHSSVMGVPDLVSQSLTSTHHPTYAP